MLRPALKPAGKKLQHHMMVESNMYKTDTHLMAYFPRQSG